jgi:hypothetical protein
MSALLSTFNENIIRNLVWIKINCEPSQSLRVFANAMFTMQQFRTLGGTTFHTDIRTGNIL